MADQTSYYRESYSVAFIPSGKCSEVVCLWLYSQSPGVKGSVLGLVGQRQVSVPWPDEVANWICTFCYSVAARAVVKADPSLRCSSYVAGTGPRTKPKYRHSCP